MSDIGGRSPRSQYQFVLSSQTLEDLKVWTPKMVERLRADLKPDAIAGRVMDDLTYKARGVAGQAMEIASDNRGIMVGTVAALAMWAARRPLGRGVNSLVQRAIQWRGRPRPETKEPEA